MPRFFFDVFGDGNPDIDDDGLVLPEAASARAEAMRLLPDILLTLPLLQPQSLVANVRDESDRTIFRATLTLAGDWVTQPPAAALC